MNSYVRFNRGLASRYDQWMVAMHYARHTQETYRRTIRLFLDFLGKKSAASVTHEDIRQFIAQVSEDGATLNVTYRHLGVLRLFYDFLNLGGVVSYVAPRLVSLRPPLRKNLPSLSESEVQRLIASTRTKRERALVEFYYSTGCRLREASHLRIENIDFRGKTARVSGKFGKVRIVLLTPSAIDAVQSYIGDRQKGLVFQNENPIQKASLTQGQGYWRASWVDYGRPGPRYRCTRKILGRVDRLSHEAAREQFEKLLTGVNLARPERDKPLSNTAIRAILKRIGNRAGLRNVGAHMIRRSFATHLYDHGASLETIQALLGHVYLQTTLTYTRLSTGRLVKTFEQCHPQGTLNDQTEQYGSRS